MSSKVRAIGRWGVALGLAGAIAGAVVVDAIGDDGLRGGSLVRVAQKQQPRKKAAAKKVDAAKQGDAARGADDPAMADPAAKADAGKPAAGGDPKAPSFQRDVAPLLVANCVGCHTGTGPGLGRGKLSMASFDKLMAGGKRGKDLIPGDPDASHLVLMIKGEETPKMPPTNTQRSVSEAAAEKVEAWVKAGARLDAGLSPADPFDKYAATATDLRRDELTRMKPEERDKVAEQAGRDRWKKATATVPDFAAGAHFLAFGNLPGDRTAKLLKAIEPQFAVANRLFGSSKGPALDPAEKISLYIFKDQNAFTEFVRAVENQDVEPGEVARGRLNVESPYLVVVDPANGGEEATPAQAKRGSRKSKKADDSIGGPERSLLGLLTEQLIVATANKAGKPPRWVSLGLGAFLARAVEKGSPYYRRLQAEALENVRIGWQAKATEVLGGQAPVETSRAVGYSLFGYINANAPPAALNAFIRVMLEGQGQLDEALTGCLQTDREQFLNGSAAWLAGPTEQ